MSLILAGIMNTENFWLAFGLTMFAGLSTGIGSLIALATNRTSTRFLSIAMGFSAGVMIYVSFVELLPESIELLHKSTGNEAFGIFAFFIGILIIAIIDRLIPEPNNPHSISEIDPSQKLRRMGIFTALAIAIHNFPEGIAAFASVLVDPKVGVPIAIAIAIHNIPEGIAVSIPIYHATGNKKQAFWLSFSSGLAEPAGALIGFLILQAVFNDNVMGWLIGGVAGVMVFISLDELLPAAHEYGEAHQAIYGLIAGMVVMAISLLLI